MGTAGESGTPAEQPRAPFRFRAVSCQAIDAATTAGWIRLEQRALEANAYLSPHFILPAVRHLDCAADPLVVLVEDGAAELVGVGVFEQRPATWRFPLPHLSAYRSRHSYLSGLLVDRACAAAAVGAFFDFFCSKARWNGVEFTWRTAEGPLADLLGAVARERGLPWREQGRSQRPTFMPAQGGEAYVRSRFSAGKHRDLSRQMRRLSGHGEVSWRLRAGAGVPSECAERFLELEHLGWKGRHGTSLRSRPEDEAFFREVVNGFRSDGRALFTELSVGDEVIASTSNFVSGAAGFGFKVGWHPDYAKQSPGMLNEVEFVRQAPLLCQDLEYFDSGAGEGSFIEKLWAGRRSLTSGIYPTTALGRRATFAVQTLRRLKRWLKTP